MHTGQIDLLVYRSVEHPLFWECTASLGSFVVKTLARSEDKAVIFALEEMARRFREMLNERGG